MNISTELIVNLLKYIGSTFGGGLLLLLIFFFFPEKVEKWSVLFLKLFYSVRREAGKKIVSHDIQGRVNEFAKSLKKEVPDFQPVGIHIQWITDGETQKEFLDKNRLVIRLRQHANQNRNFVNATMVYIANTLIPKAKRYLSPSQRESIDLFVGRKLFEKEKPQVVDRFFEDYFAPKVESSNKLMELVEKYEIIDKVGMFFPVFIQELSFLGEKVFFRPRNERIIVELTSFIDFLHRYAKREVGEKIPANFEGAYCRCGIMIIAKRFKREIGNPIPFINYIKKLVGGKIENIYIIGPSSMDNKDFIDQIKADVKREFNLDEHMTKEYKAKIMFKGQRVEVKTYLVLLRCPGAQRYYDQEYQEKYIEPALQEAQRPRIFVDGIN